MTRFEFVNKLNGRLYLLSEAERRDIIDEYVSHIDLKMAEGKSESDAIKDFGDIDELAAEILEAYHIDHAKLNDKTLDIYIKTAVDYISRSTEKLLSFSTKDLAYILVEFIILLIILNFIRYPLELCGEMFVHLFSWLPFTIFHILDRLVNIIANIISVAISLLIICQFVNRRILWAQPGFIDNIQEYSDKAFKGKKETADTKTEDVSAETDIQPDAEDKKKKNIFSLPKLNKEKRRRPAGKTVIESAEKAGDFVVNLIVILLKVMLRIFVWIPSVLLTIAGVVCTILAAIVYTFSGIGFIGVIVIGVGCCILGAGFTLWITQLLAGGKNNA